MKDNNRIKKKTKQLFHHSSVSSLGQHLLSFVVANAMAIFYVATDEKPVANRYHFISSSEYNKKATPVSLVEPWVLTSVANAEDQICKLSCI